MSSPIRPPLKIETIDGTTEGRPINTIRVSNSTLSVSGTTATITTGGGGGGSGTVTSVGTSQAFITITSPTTTPSISIGNASGAATGVLTATDWTTFNNKQAAITLTTTGSSGASTLVGSTLNIPQYSGGGGVTFPLEGSDGSASAPTYSFSSATNLGFFKDGSTALSFTSGGTRQMSFDSNGVIRLGGSASNLSTYSNNLVLDTDLGSSSGSIVIEAGANGQISITPNGTGTIKLDGVELDNTAIATGYVLKATSATEAGWAAESGGGGTFSGSLADTQVAFGNTAADSIQGSSNLTFDGSNLSVSGYIKSGAGLVTAPAYTFTAADDVGMYLVGTNVLHFTVGSSDVMNLQHDGTATNVRLGNGTGGAALSSKGLTNLTLQTNDGVNSGTIVLEDGVNGQISITPNGTGTIKLDGVELDNTAIATGYVLKATSATAAGWAAESGGGVGNDFNAELVGVELDASGTGYAVFDILSSAPFGVARYTTGSVDTKQYFYPFIAPKSGSLSEIIVNLTAAAGSATNLYYGFYRDNNGVPDSMLGYATVDATSTGSISVTSFSATVTFTRGDQFWLSQNKSTSQSITQRSIQNDYMPRIAPTEAFPNTTSGYYTSLATNSAVSAVPADITAEGLEGGVYFAGLGSKPHIGIKIL